MKRAFLCFVLMLAMAGSVFAAPTAETPFEKGLKSKRPMIVLLYAPWSVNNTTATKNFAALRKNYGSKASFVALDFASEDAKAYNDYFILQPRLPQVMMFKNASKMSVFVPRDCLLDYACVSKKVNSFVN